LAEEPTVTEPSPRAVTLLGVCYDDSSSFERGAALGPPSIREALRRESSNSWTEDGADLFAAGVLDDAGDIAPIEGEEGRIAIGHEVGRLLDRGRTPLVLGGDHSITYPVVRAFAAHHSRLALLHLDAHGDLYDQLGGDRYSHACPMARIMEEGLVQRLVQVGIRTLNAHQRAQARRFGVEVFEMKDWTARLALRFESPVYLSLDLDVLDPAFAPGVAHPEPGGLSVREVLQLLRRVEGRVVGGDLVEFNPKNDPSPRTGLVCVKLLKGLVDLIRRSG
jgi:agmatinase